MTALLALGHLEPTRPHERTLPEPYKSAWAALTNAATGEGDGKSTKMTREEKLRLKKEKKAQRAAAKKNPPAASASAGAGADLDEDATEFDFWGEDETEAVTAAAKSAGRYPGVANEASMLSDGQIQECLWFCGLCTW